MGKTVTRLLIFIVSFLIMIPPYKAHAQSGQNGGGIADYASTWILKDMSVEDSYWTLDITADGNYKLHNQYQSYEGKVDFLPADAESPATMILEIDPENGIDMFLICTPNTLVDFSQQN